MKKRFLATFLSMLLIFSSMPAITFAEETDVETAVAEAEQEEETIAVETETEKETTAVETETEKETVATEDTEMGAAAEDESNEDTNEEEVTFDSVQAMMDALPDAEDITEDNISDVEAQLDAIDEAKSVLYQAGGDVDGLDMTRYDAACEALAVLSESGETDVTALASSLSVASEEETALTSAGGELSSGNYYLDGNITLSTDITIPSGVTVTIDLNGYTLTGTGNSSVITVYGTLTLEDNSNEKTGKLTGGGANYGAGIYVRGGKFIMTGGTISGNFAYYDGGGVYVRDYNNTNASFTMNGGTISNNSAQYGGGVAVYDEFTMNGGTISDNTVGDGQYCYGGGVYVHRKSTFIMNNGTISGNTASAKGGGVFVLETNSSTFTMNSGTISKNTAGIYGGGVYAGGSFIPSGTAVVTGNIVSDGTTSQTENVYLPSGKYITLGGELKSGSSIGVTTEDEPTSGNEVQITVAETETAYYSTASGFFFSDNTSYGVRANTTGEYLELYGPLPAITGSVSITGDAVYGKTLTATLSDEVPTGVAYQWMCGTAAISGATDSTYTLTAADVGETITVVVSHTGYAGTLSASTSGEVQKATVTASISGTTTKVYDGTMGVTEEQGLSITLSGIVTGDETKVSAAAADYAYDSASVGTGKTITATGITLSGDAAGCYTLSNNTATVTGSITAAALTASMFTVDTDDETYTGSAITKAITSSLVENTDYTVSYSNNVNVGTGTIAIAGTGNYTDDLTYTFTINPKSVTASISGATSKVYDGTTNVTDAQSLSITLDGVVEGDKVTASAASYAYDSTSTGTGKTITASGITLRGTEADNYTLSSTTATAAVGTITQKSLSEDDFTVDTSDETYTGSAITKTITGSLVEDTDYAVSYSDNVNAGTASITITGMGNYTGSLTWTFTINKAAPTVSLSGVESTIYDGTAVSDPAVSVTLAGIDTYAGTPAITWYSVAGDGTETALTGAPFTAGSYKVVVTVSDAGSNYETASASEAFTIGVAEQFISYSESKVAKHINDTAFTNALTQTTLYGTISYASNNTDVATVDENGEVNIVGAGDAIITATASSSDDYNGATASYTLTVTAHSYGEPCFTWSENGKSCTASFTCADCGDVQTVTATVTSAVKTAATCTGAGITLYTATVECNGQTYTDTKEISDISATGHTEGEAVIEKETIATCTVDGSYDSVVYCTVCGEELSRDTVTVPATGHSFGEWETVTSPTCEGSGSEQRTCTVCQYAETRSLLILSSSFLLKNKAFFRSISV